MGTAVETLKAHVRSADRYDVPHGDVAALQVAAAAELSQDRRTRIRFLEHRAEEAGIDRIGEAGDLVGLLFAHTTYKSYPEQWLSQGRWPLLSKWVETLASHPVTSVDFAGITNIDDWICRMAASGHYLSCSSGTTGKSAMLDASAADMDWVREESVSSIAWAMGVEPRQQFRRFGMSAVAAVPRNEASTEALTAAFNVPDEEPFAYPVPPITLGDITGMVALRKRIADGLAEADEIATFEATSARRAKLIEDAVEITADAIVADRNHLLLVAGMWGTAFKVAEAVRARGYSGKDFNPGNALYTAGGLKGAVLPPDYREYVFETFNIAPDRVVQAYSMQEIGSSMPRCRAGRYHVPPWLMCLLLDEHGDALIPMTGGGEHVGRAGFFDISLDGRWNGVISGDRIALTHDRCDCGARSPSIRDDIGRYADLEGGDKISCAGTVDAYVRGIA